MGWCPLGHHFIGYLNDGVGATHTVAMPNHTARTTATATATNVAAAADLCEFVADAQRNPTAPGALALVHRATTQAREEGTPYPTAGVRLAVRTLRHHGYAGAPAAVALGGTA